MKFLFVVFSRYHLCRSASFAFLLYCSCSPIEQSNEAPEQPNILWVIVEDLSPDLTCYGIEGLHTPNLDQLAARGMCFEEAFTTAPVCAPSRTALATGMYQTAINAHHMRYPDELKNELPPGMLPLHEIFRRNGYQTALIQDPPANNKLDWSFSTPYDKYDTYSWKDLSNRQPFYGVFNMRLTHRPFERDTVHPIDPNTIKLPPYYPDHAIARKDFAAYLESVQLMDKLLGQIIQTLDQRNLSDNTIIIFLGDHGRPMSRGKNNLYDSGIQIPLIMAAPDYSKWSASLVKGSRYKPLVSVIDISATSLAFAGIDKPTWMQGRVIFGDSKDPERKEVFSALDRIGESNFKSRMVRSPKWKYIKNYHHEFSINEMATAYRKAMHPIYHLLNIYHEKSLLTDAQLALVRPMAPEELYDLENDPYEMHNLINQSKYEPQLTLLRNKLRTWQELTTDYGMEADSKELKKAFVDYGIASGNKYRIEIAETEHAVRQAIEIQR